MCVCRCVYTLLSLDAGFFSFSGLTYVRAHHYPLFNAFGTHTPVHRFEVGSIVSHGLSKL